MPRVRSWHMTDVGCVRDHNEDCGYADPHGRFFICSDGMGGHAAGDIASRMAVQLIGERLASWPPVFDRCGETNDLEVQRGALAVIDGALRSANSAVFERGRMERDKRGMGCTADVVVIVGQTALFGHVGDSRVYFIRGAQVQQLTVDHSFAPPALPGQPAPKGKLTSALGPNPSCKVDTFAVPLMVGDRLLMCTDGLADYFPDPREIAAVLADRGDEAGVATLIQMAKQRGGADNITVVLARMEAEDIQAAIDRSRARTQIAGGNMNAPAPAQPPGGMATGAPLGAAAVTAQLTPVRVPPEMMPRHAQGELRATLPLPEDGGPLAPIGQQPSGPNLMPGRGALRATLPLENDAAARSTTPGTAAAVRSGTGPAQSISSSSAGGAVVSGSMGSSSSSPKSSSSAAGGAVSGSIDPPLGSRERTLVDKIGVFTASALFNAVPTTEVTRFLKGAHEVQLMAGAQVPRQVKQQDTAWFILDGEHKGELLYPEALIAPQVDWGELDSPLANTTAVPFNRQTFTRFCNEAPEAGVKLLLNLARLITAELRSAKRKD